MEKPIGLIVIGDEILSRRRQDKHFAHAAGLLTARGLALSWVQYLGDDESLLVRQLRAVRDHHDICFCFGGIGATPDDRTRQAMAEAQGVPLIRHPEAIAAIEEQFGEGAYPHRILMAELPEGSRIIPNPFNRIPGFSLGDIHCLPGFPEMAWPMMTWVLDNRYPDLRAAGTTYSALTVHNAHESDLLTLMNDLQSAYPSVKVSSLPRFLPEGGRQIELGISGEPDAVAVAFTVLEKEISKKGLAFDGNGRRARLGKSIET